MPHQKSGKNERHVVLRLMESLKMHSALVKTELSMGKFVWEGRFFFNFKKDFPRRWAIFEHFGETSEPCSWKKLEEFLFWRKVDASFFLWNFLNKKLDLLNFPNTQRLEKENCEDSHLLDEWLSAFLCIFSKNNHLKNYYRGYLDWQNSFDWRNSVFRSKALKSLSLEIWR